MPSKPEPEWKRFCEVTKHIDAQRTGRLFRASAPNYAGYDDSQRLTVEAVRELQIEGRNITRVLSLNGIRYSPSEEALLDNASIAYLHIPLIDYSAPTLEQIQRAVEFFSKAPPSNLLVHCGFGHGRTGTMITAIQLWMTNGHADLHGLIRENMVERREQGEVLAQYQSYLVEQSEQ